MTWWTLTNWQAGVTVGIVVGWIACALWSAWEERRAADRAARDIREWNAAEARARLRKNVRRMAQESARRRQQTGGNGAA